MKPLKLAAVALTACLALPTGVIAEMSNEEREKIQWVYGVGYGTSVAFCDMFAMKKIDDLLVMSWRESWIANISSPTHQALLKRGWNKGLAKSDECKSLKFE